MNHGKNDMYSICFMKKLAIMLRGAAYSTCKLSYSIPREIQAILNSESNHDFHLMNKYLKKLKIVGSHHVRS